MTRLAEEIVFSIDDRTVYLRPSLRGALRIAREFGGFGPVLSGIQGGSITIISRVLREGQSTYAEPLPNPLFKAGDAALYWNIMALQAPALQLVMGWMMIDPDAKPAPADHNAEPIDPVEEFEAMFGFATGILRWTPAEAWAATPGEIIAAANTRQKAFGKKEDDKPDHSALTLDQQAMLLSARLDTRAR